MSKNHYSKSTQADIQIEFKLAAAVPVDLDYDYQVDPPELTKVLQKVQLESDRKQYFIETAIEKKEQTGRTIDEPEIYEVIGFELVRQLDRSGTLLEHPYWVYKLQSTVDRTLIERCAHELYIVSTPEDVDCW